MCSVPVLITGAYGAKLQLESVVRYYGGSCGRGRWRIVCAVHARGLGLHWRRWRWWRYGRRWCRGLGHGLLLLLTPP